MDSRGFSLDLGEQAAEPAPPEAGRQAAARPGKDLPDDAAKDDKDDAPEADPAFAWFAPALLTPPAPAPIGFTFSRAPAAPAAMEGEAAPILPTGDAVPVALPGEAQPATPAEGEAAAPVDAALPADGEAVPAKVPAVHGKIEVPAHLAVRHAAPAEAAAPARTETILNTIAALAPELQPVRRDARKDGETLATVAATATADLARTQQVTATADTQQSALDMRRHEWMTAMVERIEALRDSAGSNETRIRLSPDALGTVDISIHRQGDRVDVRFHAETPAVRAMLADAAPRLAELAEARGLRLGHASVDAGAAGQDQRRHGAPQPQPDTASAPPRARAEAATTTDQRIA